MLPLNSYVLCESDKIPVFASRSYTLQETLIEMVIELEGERALNTFERK